MKKKAIILISVLLVLGLTIVAYSYTKSSRSFDSTSCCAMADCCKDGKCQMKEGKESCAMHKKDGNAEHKCTADCCKDGKCQMNSECCKDGVCKMGCCKDGECQMHKKDGNATAMKGDCCKGKDSCPMDKKDNETKEKPNN